MIRTVQTRFTINVKVIVDLIGLDGYALILKFSQHYVRKYVEIC